jgi:putative selenate reductase
MVTLNAEGLYYRALNRRIREHAAKGAAEILIKNVLGQRYIGGGINGSVRLMVYGTPGQDLGAFMSGPEVVVFGNAQDGVGNTMNAGTIVVHGKAGEIPGHSMRGGRIFIKGDVEYRAGIHMKEYMDQVPLLTIGGTAKDYCGEYMAGGKIVVLNLENRSGSPVGYSVGTGIHGGAIYIRGPVEPYQLGIGAVFAEMDAEDEKFLAGVLREYSREFSIDLPGDLIDGFVKITRKGHRPFEKLYTPGMNIQTRTPKHLNLTPPCTHGCPTGIPTPVFFNLIKEGKVREAQLLMDEYTPFRMSVCGTVCPALCMQACNRGPVDGPLEIQKLAREYYPDFMPQQAREAREQSIAVIGAGPAGLSAAWQLSRRGYRVTVYDATADLGGKLRKAIPRERLSDEILDRDLNRIRSLPISFMLRSRVDRDAFEEIHRTFDAVMVATGAHLPRTIRYPGGERILPGLTFLVDINEGRAMDLNGREIVIIGAGNAGMDIACEAWRLGAKKVTACDIQKPLAFGKELETARKLGTDILWPKTVDRLDELRIYFKDGTDLKADIVIISIGEVPDVSFLPDSVLRDDRGYITTSAGSFQSSDPAIFGCGDIVKPGLVTDAIGGGRRAAMELHAWLNGEEFTLPETRPVQPRRINTGYFGGEAREVDRCMSCGVCIFCDRCVETCPQKALTRNGEIFTIDPERCTGCYSCVNVCPRGAIQVEDVAEFALAVAKNHG